MLIRVTTEISFKSTDEYKEMLKFEAENDMTEWHKKKSTVYTTFWKEENWMADMIRNAYFIARSKKHEDN